MILQGMWVLTYKTCQIFPACVNRLVTSGRLSGPWGCHEGCHNCPSPSGPLVCTGTGTCVGMLWSAVRPDTAYSRWIKESNCKDDTVRITTDPKLQHLVAVQSNAQWWCEVASHSLNTQLVISEGNLSAERNWGEILQPVAIFNLHILKPNMTLLVVNTVPTEYCLLEITF